VAEAVLNEVVEAEVPSEDGEVMDEGTVQERKQKQLPRNLESVFCLPISKLQGEARNLDSARRYLDLEICPGSKIRGESRNLESGWPAPVLGNCSSTPKIRAAPALSAYR